MVDQSPRRIPGLRAILVFNDWLVQLVWTVPEKVHLPVWRDNRLLGDPAISA
jgi:hypothetical protein